LNSPANYAKFYLKYYILKLEHPDIATSYSNIGSTYDAQGNYEETLNWHFKALEIREKTLGLEHHDTASSYNNIGVVYDSQENYEEVLILI
jgi:preprotein translocase subunit SecA/nephrocystin-3